MLGRRLGHLVDRLLTSAISAFAHRLLELALESDACAGPCPSTGRPCAARPAIPFGPMAISATTPITTSSLQPISNMTGLNLTVIPDAAKRRSGIQMHAPHLHLDSGLAPSARPNDNVETFIDLQTPRGASSKAGARFRTNRAPRRSAPRCPRNLRSVLCVLLGRIALGVRSSSAQPAASRTGRSLLRHALLNALMPCAKSPISEETLPASAKTK